METAKEYTKAKRNPRNMFTPSEDKLLIELVSRFGTNNWNKISELVEGRGPRQCRDRYLKYLSPDVVNGPWTKEEEDLLLEKYNIYGSSWKLIATFFPTRTDVNIKSKWNKMQRHFNKEHIKALQQLNYQMQEKSTNNKVINLPNQVQTVPKNDIQSHMIYNIFPDDENDIMDGLWSSITMEEDFFFNCEA